MAAKEVASLFVSLAGSFAKFHSDIASVSKTMDRLGRNMSKTFSGLNKVIGAAIGVAAVISVKKLIGTVGDLASKGEELSDVKDNFDRLGGSSSQIDAAKDALLGTVSALDLMKIANEGLLKQIPGFQTDFAQIAELGGRIADALGIDAKQGIDKVAAALSTAKPKQLEAVGLIVNQEKAYKAYAAAIGTTADTLNTAQKREAMQIAALADLGNALQRVAPLTDSVKNAQDALKVSMQEAFAQVGVAVNNSDELREALRTLNEMIKETNWTQVGKDVATVASIFTNMLIPAIRETTNVFGLLAENLRVLPDLIAFDWDFGAAKQAQETSAAIADQAKYAKQAADAMANLKEVTVFQGKEFVLTREGLDKASASVKTLGEAIAKGGPATASYREGFQKMVGDLHDWDQLIEKSTPNVIKHGEKSSEALKKAATEADKAAKAVDKLKESWAKSVQEFEQTTTEDALTKEIEKAIETANTADFTQLKEKLSSAIQEGFVDEWREAIEAGAVDEATVREQAKKEADIRTTEVATQIEEKTTEAYANSVEAWRGLFENAITGATFDLESALNQVAVGFAAEMAQAVFGSMGKGISSPQDLGGSIAQSIFGGGSGGGGLDLGSIFGGGSAGGGIGDFLFGAARPEGMSGPLMESGAFSEGALDKVFTGAGSFGAYATAAAVSLEGLSKVGKSTAGTIEGLGTAAGAGIGAAFGGPVGAMLGGSLGKMGGSLLGGMFGSGPTNPETLARLDVKKYLDDAFKGKSRNIFNAEGKSEKFSGSFDFGSNKRFNDKDWGKDFKETDSFNTFNAIGTGLTKLLGITEDIGPQIGMILSENLNGNLDNARMLMQELGVSQQQMEEAFVSMGETGEMSWHAVEVALQGVSGAFGEGLVAQGDMIGGFNQIVDSGGDGKDAIIAIRNAAVEAGEAGVTSFEQWKNALLSAGGDPEMVESFFNALNQRGLQSLDQIKEASTRTLGGVIADMQSLSPKLMEQWVAAQKSAQAYIDTIAKIPDESSKSVTINVDAHISEDAKKAMELGGSSMNVEAPGNVPAFATGGVVTKPTLGLIGEAGPEAILPLSVLDGMVKSAAMSNISPARSGRTYRIDARGAAPGVEAHILRALAMIEERSVESAIRAVGEARDRGGSFSDSF